MPSPPPLAVLAAAKPPNKKNGGADARQLLGVRGAADTDNKWAIRLQALTAVPCEPRCSCASTPDFF